MKNGGLGAYTTLMIVTIMHPKAGYDDDHTHTHTCIIVPKPFNTFQTQTPSWRCTLGLDGAALW
eukprot:m.97594 g.97594  ORF g.97594 m.97594 type:complete len:64 (-) comp20542_c0_seq2:987-1178(-)